MLRRHKNITQSKQQIGKTLKVSCSRCSNKFLNQSLLIQHLNIHLKHSESINCPIRCWGLPFTNSSTFRSHMLRKHNSSSFIHDTEITFNDNSNDIKELNELVDEHDCLDKVFEEEIFSSEDQSNNAFSSTLNNPIIKSFGFTSHA